MRKFAYFLIFISFVLIFCGIILNFELYITNIFQSEKKETKMDYHNDYYRNYSFLYVQDSKNTTPKNYQELLNVFYSILNRGYDKFEFTCDKSYTNCIDDVKNLSKDKSILSAINTYVHPFNSYSQINIGYSSNKDVSINIKRNYSKEKIESINSKVDSLYNELYNNNLSVRDNIKIFHDYIINNTKYDEEKANDMNNLTYSSETAYGTLIEHYAICSGYTDAMQLFLEKMNIKSFRIASDKHIWNALFIDNNWYNLDLTWDDPITSDNSDYLDHNFFLINTKRLLELDVSEHTFNHDKYLEVVQE